MRTDRRSFAKVQVRQTWPGLPILFRLVLGQTGHGELESFGGSGDRPAEEGRSSPLIGACQDSRCFVEKSHMVHALKSDAFELVRRMSLEMLCEELEPNIWRDRDGR